jgi:hypothetical protein
LPTDFQELSFTSPQTTAGAAAFTAYSLLVYCSFTDLLQVLPDCPIFPAQNDKMPAAEN